MYFGSKSTVLKKVTVTLLGFFGILPLRFDARGIAPSLITPLTTPVSWLLTPKLIPIFF